MVSKKINCTVLGHADGPLCEVCSNPMDSILVGAVKAKNGYKAHYCYHCTFKNKSRSSNR